LGDFFYGKNSSDNLNLIYSVKALSGKMIALFYLGILTYFLFGKNEELPIGKENPYFFLDLLKIQHMKLILYLRYIFILLCAIITSMKEKIVIKCNCCKFLKRVS
jgi:hypothetical protein